MTNLSRLEIEHELIAQEEFHELYLALGDKEKAADAAQKAATFNAMLSNHPQIGKACGACGFAVIHPSDSYMVIAGEGKAVTKPICRSCEQGMQFDG